MTEVAPRTLKSYRELDVWQKAMSWTEGVYTSSRGFPQEERFGLTSQLRRAAVSVAANIAEGAERAGTAEFLQFLSIASGSLAESETLLVLAERLGMLPEKASEELLGQAGEINRMLTGLRRSLIARRAKTQNGEPTTGHQPQATNSLATKEGTTC
jgi:four helix bundle protein